MERTRTRPRGGRPLLAAAVVAMLAAVALVAPGTAQAGFFTDEATLTGSLTGPGSGFVTSDDGNLSCTRAANVNTPSPCSFEYSWSIFFPGPTPTLTATPAAGSAFTGWSVNPATAIVAGCGTGAQCEVNVDLTGTTTITVTANFILQPNTFPLTVLKAGVGAGTVTSNPAGIDCGLDCGESYVQATAVTLTATPNAGSTFGGWSGGGCAGTGTCVVTMNAAQTVTATFNAQTFPLTVTVNGPSNSGGVSSNPAGIACPGTCTFSYVSGTNVTLTAQAAGGFSFQGWSGAGCSGTATCIVPMTQAQSVTATFASAEVQASVVGTRFARTGPPSARRVLKVTVAAQQDLARIVLRLRRGGVTIQSRTVRNFDADRAVINFPVRNGIASGAASLQVTFTNTAGTQKQQSRTVRVPVL